MKTALLVIDFINDIVSPTGKIASVVHHASEKSSVAHANLALKYARQQGWVVILIKVGFSKHYLEQPKESPIFGKADQFQALTLGEWGTDFVDQLDVELSDAVIVKPRVSPFYATHLEAILRANKIERLVICGVSTAWAIQAAVREGHDRDYSIVLIEDACAAANEEEHQQCIHQLSRICKVIKVKELNSLS